jgi:hypothetical protein
MAGEPQAIAAATITGAEVRKSAILMEDEDMAFWNNSIYKYHEKNLALSPVIHPIDRPCFPKPRQAQRLNIDFVKFYPASCGFKKMRLRSRGTVSDAAMAKAWLVRAKLPWWRAVLPLDSGPVQPLTSNRQ